MYLPDIGTKLRHLRSQRDMSQVTLATRLGVSKSVVSSYENGIHLPPYDVLIQMARIFGVSTDYLLGMNSGCTISVDGLTDTQIEAVTMIVNELRAARGMDRKEGLQALSACRPFTVFTMGFNTQCPR